MKIKKFIFDLKTGVFKNALCLLMFICGVLVHAQDPPQYGTPFKNVPDSRDINMYQINIRAFSAKGDFKGVTAKLDNIKDLGINVIYLMPIYPVGTDNRSLNSPYCIKDFKAIGAEFGSLRDFRELVDAAHERGIAVMLDFVVNQTSWDHPWITQHPDWFMKDGNGVIQPPSAAYKDVAGLDLSNQDMRAAMIDALRYWVFAANIDGYRMDFANNPPLEFWQQINTNLRSITSHDLLLLAEGDRPEHFHVGFDLNFGFRWFYGALKKINNEGLSVSKIQSINDSEYQFANEKQQVVRYTENHDSNTAEGTAIKIFGGTDAVFANFVVSAYMKGVPYLYSGQEVGSTTVIPFPWSAVNINWNQNPQITSEFKKILDFRLKSTAVRRGSLFNFSNNNVAAFTKLSGNEEVLVLTNLRSKNATISLPDAVANATWKNAYTGNAATVGSTVSLKAFEYRVYVKGKVNGTLVANAGKFQSLPKNTKSVNLKGSGSDADNNKLLFKWKQISGPASTIVNAGKAATSVKGLINGATYTYELTVSNGSATDTDRVRIRIGQSDINQSPYGGKAQSLPGIVEVERFDNGGQGIAYSDNDVSNNGGASRPYQSVDIETCSEGGFNIFSTKADEWTEYTVNVATAGTYVADARVAAGIGGKFKIEFKGSDKTGEIKVPDTGGWQSWKTVTSRAFKLSAGVQIMRIYYITGRYNINNIAIVKDDPTTNSDAYFIKNRWLGSYLYDAGNQAKYGDVKDSRAQWRIETVEGFKLFKNVATGDYLNIEGQKDFVESTSVDSSFWSAQWAVEDYDGYKRIKNRWKTDKYVNIESRLGYAQSTAGVFVGAYSTHWTLEAVNSSSFNKDFSDQNALMEQIGVYPVPVKDELNISIPQGLSSTYITMYDIRGRKLLEKNFENNGIQAINVDGLTKGLYLLTIYNGKNKISRRIVKE